MTEEAGLGDAVGFGFKARGEMEDVTADGVGDVDARGGVGEFAGVARGLEVVEDGVAEHALSIPRRARFGQWMDAYGSEEGLNIS